MIYRSESPSGNQVHLVANAPHIPVHLGSMSESVKTLIQYEVNPQQGDVFASNNPYNGGTHLPDITVITPVFLMEAGILSNRSNVSPLGLSGIENYGL